MTSLSLKITNLDNVQIGIGTFGKALPTIVQQDVIDAVNAIKAEYMGGEPGGYSVPPPYGSTYERTGNLGRSMWVEQSGLTVTFRVEAYQHGREYGHYVIGYADGTGQAGRMSHWPRQRIVAEDKALALVDKCEAHLTQAAEAFGL